MMDRLRLFRWIDEFMEGNFDADDVKTQIKAGWYDWFCKDSSLANKTKKMGNIIKQVKRGGKVDVENWYVWFKNNCPLNGPLYDDFRFADIETGNVMFTIQIDCCWNKKKYTVWGRRILFPSGEYEDHFDGTPMFECDNSRELVKWLNTAW